MNDATRDNHPLADFAHALQAAFALPGDKSPEEQLKTPVSGLIAATGDGFNIEVECVPESPVRAQKVRPDIGVYANRLICGYVELKKPGLGADAQKLPGKHNREQWRKLTALPNLIYSDGREWALYRYGERQGPILRLADDPCTVGAKSVTAENEAALNKLLRNFLFWEPNVPHKPEELARYLAPLTRFMRGEVAAALATKNSGIDLLANEWRGQFFPNADDAAFADAYAQTVTYALLLARLLGATSLQPEAAARTLDQGNGLLARVLEILGQRAAKEELKAGFALLQRALEALDAHEFLKADPDLWLYFYEDFLAAYDPKLRKNYGVYYTPREVVELQVRLVDELLDKRFDKKLGFADDGVVFIDPAVGTGTYPVAAVKSGLTRVREYSGPGAVPSRATTMAENMYGLEILIGPYAVAHLRLSRALEGEGANLSNPAKRLKIYLADTLESPHQTPPGGLSLTWRTLTQEHEAARQLKNTGDILVCLGNPPYGRQEADGLDDDNRSKGGWVRFGDRETGGATPDQQDAAPILQDFINPALAAGHGGHIRNIYNDYVYFWRWALWRLFEQQNCGGIVSFITGSSYLSGPSFVGMREVMRRTFDELWIIDLGGDNRGARKNPNVFDIQTPVAIAVGVRGKSPTPDKPAKVRYVKVTGDSRPAKLTFLNHVNGFDGISWQDCPNDWQAPFLPAGKGTYFEWPRLDDLFPWVHSGVKFDRTWPIGETPGVLEKRWQKLMAADFAERRILFKETRDRKTADKFKSDLPGDGAPAIASCNETTPLPNMLPYAWRSFDRRVAFYDVRLGDLLRPDLYRAHGDEQIYFATLNTCPLGQGPAITSASHLPDMHCFRGSFGGKDIIPLYCDKAGTIPNITDGLPEYLEGTYGIKPTAEYLAAYVYALLGGQSYTRRFWCELETPGARVPMTKDKNLFLAAAALGRRLIWLHSYGERCRDAAQGRGNAIPSGVAKCITGIATDAENYPETFSYDAGLKQIQVGNGSTGRFGPVVPEIWEFEVSGLKVVQSWLGYRMRRNKGKKLSPLDGIRPDGWPPRMTDEFLELLWVLEATLAMEPELSEMLDRIVEAPCFTTAELPPSRLKGKKHTP